MNYMACNQFCIYLEQKSWNRHTTKAMYCRWFVKITSPSSKLFDTVNKPSTKLGAKQQNMFANLSLKMANSSIASSHHPGQVKHNKHPAIYFSPPRALNNTVAPQRHDCDIKIHLCTFFFRKVLWPRAFLPAKMNWMSTRSHRSHLNESLPAEQRSKSLLCMQMLGNWRKRASVCNGAIL